MIQLCQQVDLPEPEFQEYSGGLSVTFRLKTAPERELPYTLSPRQIGILKLLEGGVMRADEIHSLLEKAPSLRTVKADLTQLLQAGWVERVGRGKATRWQRKSS